MIALNISVKCEYALKAIFELAANRSGDPVKVGEISRRWKIPQKFLESILAMLRQGGFVESRRGAEGGYLLARPAKSITVGDILRHIEGERGRPDPADPFADVWERVDGAVSGIVDKTNFAELVRTWTERQERYVPNWDI